MAMQWPKCRRLSPIAASRSRRERATLTAKEASIISLTIQLDDAIAEVVQELGGNSTSFRRRALSAYVQTGQRVLPKAVGKHDSKFSEHIDRELNRLARLPPNWDAEGAQPIAPEIIAAARRFADQLPKNLVPVPAVVPAVVPMSKGNLQFEWHDGPRSLELEFETPGTIHYLKWHQEQGLEEEDVFPTTDLAKVELLVRWFNGSLTNA